MRSEQEFFVDVLQRLNSACVDYMLTGQMARNFWGTPRTRLKVPHGDRGCLSLYGDKPEAHRLLAEHLTAEYRVRTAGRGRTVDEWRLRPERTDSHWLDCLVGSAVAASTLGPHLPATGTTLPRPKPRQSLADLREAARRRG